MVSPIVGFQVFKDFTNYFSPVSPCLVPTLPSSETQYCLQILQRLPFSVPTILIAVLSAHDPALLEVLTEELSKLHGNKLT